MRFYFVLFLSLMTTACSTEKETAKNHFTNEKCEAVVIDTIYSDSEYAKGNITDLICWGDYLIVLHPEAQNMFSLIDKNTGEIVRECCQVGRASNESLSYGGPLTVVDTLLYYTDLQSRELCAISLPQMLKKERELMIKRMRYKYEADFKPSKTIPVNDKIAYTGCFTNTGFGVTNIDGEIINHDIDYPFETGLKGIERGMVYQRMISSGINNGKIIIATIFSDQFEIIQVDPEIKRVFANDWTFLPFVTNMHGRFSVKPSKSRKGIMDICSDEENIAILYHADAYNMFPDADEEADKIQFYDWDGNRFAWCDLPVHVQACTKDDKYVYALSRTDERNTIYKLEIRK